MNLKRMLVHDILTRHERRATKSDGYHNAQKVIYPRQAFAHDRAPHQQPHASPHPVIPHRASFLVQEIHQTNNPVNATLPMISQRAPSHLPRFASSHAKKRRQPRGWAQPPPHAPRHVCTKVAAPSHSVACHTQLH
jgi:hypothetical protein